MRYFSRFCLLLISLSLALLVQAETPAAPESNAKTQPQVDIRTSMGTITITLLPEKAPITVANFLEYVDAGFYDNTVFHRVVPNFVIQGGGFTSNMRPRKTRSPIVNESNNGLANRRGTLSMARTSQPDSATSQFFINLENNPSLNASFNKAGYAVFAKVTEGLPIIDMISRVATGRIKQYQNAPLDPIIILSMRRKSDS